MKKQVLILMSFALCLSSCIAMKNTPKPGEKWRAKEFKDLDHPTDVIILKVDSNKVTYSVNVTNESSEETVYQFKQEFQQYTLPNSNIPLQRYHNKKK